MKSHHISIVAAALMFCTNFIVVVVNAIPDLCMVPIRMAKVSAEVMLQRFSFSVEAYRIIAMLKPEYDESLDTHGLSLAGATR